MPKKKDGSEPKKSRKSSAASKDTTASPSGGIDLLPPLNPNVTHMVASNPFDDPPPSNQMKMMQHGFPSQSMMRMGNPGYPGWSPRGPMRPPYNGPSTPVWNTPMHGNSGMIPHGYHTGLPPNHNIPNSGYGRQPFSGARMPSYGGSPRISLNGIRPGMGPLGSPEAEVMMHEMPNIGPNHMVSTGNHGHMLQNTGQMKALTRPSPQLSSPSTRKNSTSSLKNDTKSPKNSEGSTKSRKKSEKKSAHDSKSKATEGDKHSSNGVDHGVIPHSVPPKEPQVCKRCNNSLNYPAEDAIRCLASCNMWYHRTCVGLTPDAFNFLKTEELAIWACDHCLQTKDIHSVRTRVPVLDDQMAAA